MTMPEAALAAPFDEQLLVADVVDTLRRGGGGLPGAAAARSDDPALFGRLRELYGEVGLEVPDRLLAEGIAAHATGRFDHVPLRGPRTIPAHLYVRRRSWAPAGLGLAAVLAIGLAGYFLAYRPYRAAQRALAQQELQQGLPGEMDALYRQIFNETKVQSAATEAAELRDRGKAAATRADRAAAEQAIAGLRALRDRLGQAYTLQIVDRNDVRPAFWTFPQNNTEATNYYLVVEAVDADGRALELPITSEQTGLTETVSRWGLRVPQAVYDVVMADKQDDGIIEHSFVGIKQDGFLDVDYAVPVIGGTVTQW